MADPENPPLRRAEFIALMAMMFATIAFSIDAMLPALPDIAVDIAPGGTSQAALIITFFVIGMGIGTLFMGPLSDALGRKTVLYLGLSIYVLGAVMSWAAPTLEWMLAARVLQGLGASGPRVVSVAVIRDLYGGRAMASILSLVMMIFLLVPGIAPLMGALISEAFGWRAIFAAFVIFALLLFVWFEVRMPETLARADRRPLQVNLIVDAIRQMISHPTVRLSILVQSLMMAILYSMLSMVQPIFDVSFGLGETFHFWFGAIAVASGVSSLLNSRMVGRFGMRRLATWSMGVQVILSAIFALYMTAELPATFAFCVFWLWSVMFNAGLTVANLNAIAMEPMGHIAGMAASVIGSISTIIGALIASPVAWLFDGTPLPLVLVVLVFSAVGSLLLQMMRRAEATA